MKIVQIDTEQKEIYDSIIKYFTEISTINNKIIDVIHWIISTTPDKLNMKDYNNEALSNIEDATMNKLFNNLLNIKKNPNLSPETYLFTVFQSCESFKKQFDAFIENTIDRY